MEEKDLINNQNFSIEAKQTSDSAERQLLALKKAQNSKIQEVKDERLNLIALKRTLSDLIYATCDSYKKVYPFAEGFIEGRIKSVDSIEIKTKNEITEILEKIEEDPNINQEKIIEAISKIGFKDLIAFSVVTSKTPERFKTGSDEKNKEFTNLSSEIRISEKRIDEHNKFVSENQNLILDLKNDLTELRSQESKALSEEAKKQKINRLRNKIIKNSKDLSGVELQEYLAKELNDLIELSQTNTQEHYKEIIDFKSKMTNIFRKYIDYGNSNLTRTRSVLIKSLRDLQYKMSEYFVENLKKFSTFKFWGATSIRNPKRMLKPGFRAANTGYEVVFTADDNTREKIKFEVQGKGEIDHRDAEFSPLGAKYHEEQKTKDGIISKNIEMPDFTIIGETNTNMIEKEIRTKFSDVTTIEEFEDYNYREEADLLKKYEAKIKEAIQSRDGVNSLTSKEIKTKMNEVIEKMKEACIQKEIKEKINEKIKEMVTSEEFSYKLQNNLDYSEIYSVEKEKLEASGKFKDEEMLDYKARVKTIYKLKEKEIKKYSETSIPMFFRANISSKDSEEPIIYWYTTGESIYKFFVNRLNGMKDSDGNYVYAPHEQQKIALFKLDGLFEEDINNFYTYDRKKDEFCNLPEMDEAEL